MARARAHAFKLAYVNAALLLIAVACGSGSEPPEQTAAGPLEPGPAQPSATEEPLPMATVEPEPPVGPEPTVAPTTVLVDPVPPPEPGDVVEVVCVAQSAASE